MSFNTAKIKLVSPSVQYQSDFISALEAGPFTHNALNGFGDWGMERIGQSFDQFVDFLNFSAPREIPTPDGRKFRILKHEIKWAIDDKGRFVGGLSIRRDADSPLINLFSGHLGLSVRADRYGEGLGTAMLKAALNFIARDELRYVLVSALPENIASNKMIQKAGGVLASTQAAFGFPTVNMYYLENNKNIQAVGVSEHLHDFIVLDDFQKLR